MIEPVMEAVVSIILLIASGERPPTMVSLYSDFMTVKSEVMRAISLGRHTTHGRRPARVARVSPNPMMGELLSRSNPRFKPVRKSSQSPVVDVSNCLGTMSIQKIGSDRVT